MNISDHNNYNDICFLVYDLYITNSSFKIIYILELLSALLSSLLSLFIMLSICLNKTLHFNIRILLISFFTSLIIANIG